MQARRQNKQGSIVVTILIVMLLLSTMVFGVVILANSNLFRAWGRILLLQAQYAAESGADNAIATLNNTNSNFTGTTSDVTVLSNALYKATFATTVATSGANKVITSTGKVYKPATASAPSFTRTIRVTVQETSGSTASSVMASNDIYIASAVKNIVGTNIYVNGFISLAKNVNQLSFSSLTVAGKDTGAQNCSIEGSGSLVNNPSSQKATVDVAYNNCISPPGNSSNANFNVTANDSSVSKIQSLYIPWSAYMDSSYQNSPTGCADWTAASPVTIPSTGNTKKTHYPDTGSGVSTSCGTNGNLNLGSNTYNITDNVHVRANLCATSACSPTFNNTSGSLKFIFVEGSVNFGQLTSAAGSSPLVIFAYGTDPGTHGGCPYGDSVYLGNSGDTTAPAIYLMSINSVCADKTKFGANPALGGLAGKNLYVNTNSGTPFDLNLNLSFPDSQVPINFAWKATGYERL